MNLSKEKKNLQIGIKKKGINSTNITLDSGRKLTKGNKRGSYSDIFKEKLKYVSPDIGLSHNKDGSYSNFYKDGLKINNDEIEKSSSNISSLRNSIIISHSEKNITDGNSPIKKNPNSPLKKSLLKNKNNNNLLNSPDFRNNNEKNKEKKSNENGNENYFIAFTNRKNNKEDDNNNEIEKNEKNNKEILLSDEKGKKNKKKIKKLIDNEKDNLKNNSEKKILKSENKDKNNLFRKSFNQNKNNSINSPLTKKNKKRNSGKYKSNDDIIKCNGSIKNEKNINEIKEVDEEDETEILGTSSSHKKGLFNLVKDSDKKINFYKKNSGELNGNSNKNIDLEKLKIELNRKKLLNGNNQINNNKKEYKNNTKKLLNNILLSKRKLIFGNEMNTIFKKSNSFENIIKQNKDFELTESEIKKFIKKSKSYDFLFNYKNFEQINEILQSFIKDKKYEKKKILNNLNSTRNSKNQNKNNLNNKRNTINSKEDFSNEEKNMEMTRTNTNIKTNQNQNEIENEKNQEESNIKNIFTRGKNTNNLTKKLLYSLNSLNSNNINNKNNENNPEKKNNVINKRKYTNIDNKDNNDKKKLHKNPSEIPRRNLQSFILRGGKKIGSESSTISLIDSINSDFGKKNNTLNAKMDETTEKINHLINKIRENSKDNILNIYKQQNEKILEKLKKEKNDLKIKKNILNQEKLKKGFEKDRNQSEKISKRWKKSHNTILSIHLPNQITNEYEKVYFNLNKKLLKARSDLNILSEPIYTNKEINFSSEKQSCRNFSDNKKELINLDNNSNGINHLNTVIRKSESFVINSYYSKNIITEKNTNYLEIMKEDLKNIKKNKLKDSSSSITLRKVNRKNYIMPVNSLEDIIQIKKAYVNLNANLNVNKSKKK